MSRHIDQLAKWAGLHGVVPPSGDVVDAFALAMGDNQYGVEETWDAFCWFRNGFNSAGAKCAPVSEIEPWVMTADRMPAHGEDVLFVTRHGRWLGWRRQENGDWLDHFNDDRICADAAVLCWMPIPATPDKIKVNHEQLRTIADR